MNPAPLALAVALALLAGSPVQASSAVNDGDLAAGEPSSDSPAAAPEAGPAAERPEPALDRDGGEAPTAAAADAGSEPGGDGETAGPAATAEWKPQQGALSVHAEDATVEEVARALEVAGVDVKTEASWEPRRITASFADMPLEEAAKQLFERSYILVWSRPQTDSTTDSTSGGERPRIVLLALRDDAPAPAGASGPPPDAKSLVAAAESGSAEEAAPVLEAALRRGDAALRRTALELLAKHRRLAVDSAALRSVAREDPEPALRRQALGVIVGRVDLESVESLPVTVGARPGAARIIADEIPAGPTADAVETLSAAASDDRDSGVREAAQSALDNLASRAEILGSLSQAERDWLFREDVLGPLSAQLKAIERARGNN